MDLLIGFILAIVVGAFLQHGFSAIAGRESIIDKITGGKKEDGVTGRIAPPANRVPPDKKLSEVKPEVVPKEPGNSQCEKIDQKNSVESGPSKKNKLSGGIVVLAVLLFVSMAGNVYLYSAMDRARSEVAYIQSEREKEIKLKEDLLEKYQETADTLAFWSARGCVVKDGSSVYHEDIYCPQTDEDNLSVMSIKDALSRGYTPCDRCANEWKALYFKSIS